MIWIILRCIFYPFALFIAYRLYKAFWGYLEYKRQVAAGVPYISGYNYFGDMMSIEEVMKDTPTIFNWGPMLKKGLGGVTRLPPLVGVCFFGEPMTLITRVEPLQDIYVNKTQYSTKHSTAANYFSYLMPNSILINQTADPLYVKKRKELSGAFFKSKLLGMTKIIKEVALKEIKRIQYSGKTEIDINKMTIQIQSSIIINVAVGMGCSD